MEDPTLYHGTFDTTGCNSGSDADVTKVTDTNFQEIGSNPSGIADWEAKFEMLHQMRQLHHAHQYVVDILAELANGERS